MIDGRMLVSFLAGYLFCAVVMFVLWLRNETRASRIAAIRRKYRELETTILSFDEKVAIRQQLLEKRLKLEREMYGLKDEERR